MNDIYKWIASCCLESGNSDCLSIGNDVTMFSLVARTSLNELNLVLPLMTRHITHGEEVEMENGKILARPANKEDYENFATHLIIVENVIQSLIAKDIEIFDKLDSLLEQLQDTIRQIMLFLEEAYKNWDTLEKENSDRFNASRAALRLASVWFSESNGIYEEECKRFFIELLIKNLDLNNELPNPNLYLLALHSICAENDDMLRHLLKVENWQQILESHLNIKSCESRRGLVQDLLNSIKSIV